MNAIAAAPYTHDPRHPLVALFDNVLEDTDSYKTGHYLQFPTGLSKTFFYLESRGGRYQKTLFFGLQAIVKAALCRPITHAMVDEMVEMTAWRNEPFNEAGFRAVVDRKGGFLPMRIRAVREGALVPVHNALMTLESTDPEFAWLPSYFETVLMRVWYPTTVATLSWYVKQAIRAALRETSDDAEAQLPYKLHDFGSRGVSSRESAAYGAMAHLVNFRGTDTYPGLKAAKLFYNEPKAGDSIAASEHSSILTWGRAGEEAAYRNMLRRFGKQGAIFACVSDTYDIFNAITNLWGGSLREEVIASGAMLVVRPDSGDPVAVVAECLERLDAAFGSTVNGKGFKVLNHVRLIQGDGVNPDSIAAILERVVGMGYSIDNLAFGMGGALLQKVDRDTQKFALKLSYAVVDGEERELMKDPITDPGKRSKPGLLTLLRHKDTGVYRTAHPREAGIDGWLDAMHTIYEDGVLTTEWTFEQVRARSNAPL